jgi:hypothetical protein
MEDKESDCSLESIKNELLSVKNDLIDIAYYTGASRTYTIGLAKSKVDSILLKLAYLQGKEDAIVKG